MRVTRAALRAQTHDEPGAISIHQDPDADTTQDEDILQDRSDMKDVLRDITSANSTTAEEMADLKHNTTPRLPQGNRRKNKQSKDAEDVEAGQADKVTAQAAVDTIRSGKEVSEQKHDDLSTPETLASVKPLDNTLSETEAPKVQTPDRTLAMTSKTPKFDPELHVAHTEPPSAELELQDSFVESIKTRSPIKLSREPSRDSFVDSIKSRSPAKRQSRIEDSVEAMDALEDAIEEISTKLPQIEHIEIESPIKAAQHPPQALLPSVRKTALETKVSTTPQASKPSPAKTKPAQLKAAPARTNSGRASAVKPVAKGPTISKSTTRVTTAPRPATTIEAPKVAMSFSNSPLKNQPNLAKKRLTSGPLSTSRPAFIPAKSTKAPTKSTFALPGEAYQAKMKAQREERVKQDEEAKAKKTFKARPVPNMTSRPSVAPRENKASMARKSSALNTNEGENKENEAPKRSVMSRPSIAPVSKTVSVKKVRPEVSAIQANSSIRRITGTPPNNSIKKPAPAPRQSLASKPASRPSIAPHVAPPPKVNKTYSPPASSARPKPTAKVTGKEVYGRIKGELGRAEKEKREKEEASKNARAAAAERGRQASREWAEKQRLKAVKEKAAAASPAVRLPVEGAIVEAS